MKRIFYRTNLSYLRVESYLFGYLRLVRRILVDQLDLVAIYNINNENINNKKKVKFFTHRWNSVEILYMFYFKIKIKTKTIEQTCAKIHFF